MLITQDTNKDSLDIRFNSTAKSASLSIKQGLNDEAILEINGVQIDPGSLGSSPITLFNLNTTYSKKQLVVKDGELYRSLTDDNIGNDPEKDSNNWAKLEHVIEYSNTLPEANEKSVIFVEVDGQLYYKTILKDNYVYKKISAEAGPDTSGIIDVLVDNKSVVMNNKAWITSAIKNYDSLFPYSKDDLVIYSGIIFKSLENDNINNIPGKSEKWIDIIKSYYHVEEIPEATLNTPSFLEYRGDLYYKVEDHSGKYISFSYVKSSTESKNADSLEYYNEQATYSENDYVFYLGKVYQSLINNNRGNLPSNNSTDYWKLLTLSIQKLSANEVEFAVLDENTLYEIVESRTYTDAITYDFSYESKHAGWKVTEYGLENPISRMSIPYSGIPNRWDYIHELLDYSVNGPIAVAYNEAGSLVCRYKKPFLNYYKNSVCIYDNNIGLIKIAESSGKIYDPLTIICDNFIETSILTTPKVWDLSDIEIDDLVETFLTNNNAYISTSDGSFKSSVIYAETTSTDKKISILFTNGIVINYTKSKGSVSYSIAELTPSIIELTKDTGQLDGNLLTDSTIIKYTSPSDFNDYYLRKNTDTQDSLVYSCDEYKMIINTSDYMYEINSTTSSVSEVFTIETSYIGIEGGSTYYVYPDLSYSSISQLAEKLDSEPVAIKVRNDIFKVSSIIKEAGDSENPETYILTLSYYNKTLNDTVIVTYKSSIIETKVEMKPVHNIVITRYDNGGDITGTLPENIRDIYKHSDNATNTVVRFEQGDDWAPKISNLKYEYREDKEYFYMNNEFACQISLRDYSYIIVAI